MMSEKKNPPKKDWQDSLEKLKAELEASEQQSRKGVEVPVVSDIAEEKRIEHIPSDDRKDDARKELKTGKPFLFRKKEWGTRELSDEFFRLKERMLGLQQEKTKRRLSDEKWGELRSIQNDLEYIGPELERREKDARRTKRKKTPVSKGKQPVPSVVEAPVKADDARLWQIRKIIDMLPEEGKKTFLDGDTVESVAELAKIKSAIHNNQEEIRKAKKNGKSTDFGKLVSLQNRRDAIIESLKATRAGLNGALSESDSDGNAEAESSARDREERRSVRKKFQLSHAVEELNFIIGEAEKGKTNDMKGSEILSSSESAIDEKNPSDVRSDLGPDIEPTTDQVTSETVVEPEPGGEADSETVLKPDSEIESVSKSMTEKEIHAEISRLLWILAGNQGGPEEFEQEISDLKAQLEREKNQLDDLKKNGGDEFVSENIARLEGDILRAEKHIRNKEADLELRRNPESLREKIDALNLEKIERFPDRSKKVKKLKELPPLESDAERLNRRADALRSELESHDSYLRALEAERTKAQNVFEGLVSRWSEQMKKIEEIKKVLTDLKSSEEITAKMESEKPVTTDDLRKIDEEMTRIEEAKKKTRAELTAVKTELESFAKAPDVAPGAVPTTPKPVPDFSEGEENPDVQDEGVKPPEPVTPDTSQTATPEADLVKPLSLEPDPEPLSLPDESESHEEKELSDAVQEKFKGLGITSAELLMFDGFSELTEGQQLFVAESLSQAAARNIEDSARDTAKGGIFKGYHVAKARKEIAEKVLHGGINEYRQELGQLIGGVKMSGLDVEGKADGTFDIKFLSSVQGLENDATATAEWAAFNGAANAFSKIPQEWSLEEASKSDRRKYDEAKQVYDAAQDRLSGFIDRERTDPNDYKAVRDEYVALRVADNRVRLVQHLQAHPEIGKHLEKLERQNLFAATLTTTGAERTAYFAGGVAGRFALMGAGVASLAAAPIIASILGGVTGYRRAKENLAEQDRQARRGIESPVATKGADNGGWFKKLLGKPEELSQEKLAGSKRTMVHAAASEKDRNDGRKRGLAERLDNINDRVAKLSADDAEGMKRELKNLVARVDSVKKKLDDDQVSFGDGAEGIRSRIRLLEALSRAETTVGIFTDADDSKEQSVSYRFERMFGEKQKQEEERVKSARSDYKWFETKKGAVMSGTIGLLGASVAQGAHAAADWLHHANIGAPTPLPGGSGAGASSHEIADKAVKAATKIKGGVAPDSTIPHSAPIQPGMKSMAPAGALKEAVERTAEKSAKAASKVFAETAKPGDGMTHLARRALAEYVGQHKDLSGLTAEQKVYIEDYLQKKVAHAGTVHVGSKVEFTKDLMDEAIGKAKGLNEAQLQNLKQFADQVHEFRAGTVPAPEVPVAGPANAVAEAASAPAPTVPTEALDVPVPKAPVAPEVASVVPGPKVPQVSDSDLPAATPTPKALPNIPADAEVYGPIPPKGDQPFFWSPKESRQVFQEIGRMPAKDVPKIIIQAARKPFWDGTGMDPRRARYIGDLFREARREGIIPGRKPLHEFLDQVARSHHDPERMKVFADSADIARRYSMPDEMNNE
ncbi:MAG: hypothetical protein WCJ25_00865 [Candidatus Moraniibacteriota bacterium]